MGFKIIITLCWHFAKVGSGVKPSLVTHSSQYAFRLAKLNLKRIKRLTKVPIFA